MVKERFTIPSQFCPESPRKIPDSAHYLGCAPATHALKNITRSLLMKTFKLVDRWVLVLPVAITAFFAIQVLFGLIGIYVKQPHWTTQLMNSIAGPYAF